MGDELDVEDALRKKLQIQRRIKLTRTAAMVRNVADVPRRLELLHAIKQVLIRSTTVPETPQ